MIMSKNGELIKQLNQSADVLTKENREVFDDIVIYIRTSNLKIKDMEEFLQQILDSFINAQNNDKNIESVLGTDDIKKYCDDIIETYKSTYNFMELFKEYIMYAGMFLLILPSINYIAGIILSAIKNKGFSNFSLSLNVNLELLIQFIVLIPLIYVGFAYARKGCFSKKEMSPVKEFLILWVICVCFIGVYILILHFAGNRVFFSINIFAVLAIGAVLYFVGHHYSEK